MTLAVAVVTSDGIVVAADSRTTWGGNPTRVLSDFTHKVFRVGDVAIATFGFAFLSGRNIAGHMGEFAQQAATESPGPEKTAELLRDFFGERLERHFGEGSDTRPDPGVDSLGFLIGGYSDGMGSIWELGLPTANVSKIADSASGGGAAWRGQGEIFTRLVKGVDLSNLLILTDGADGLRQNIEALQPTFEKMEFAIPFGSMGLQDAIDIAVLAIRTTIDVQRLTFGTIGTIEQVGSWPGVGGPIEIAAVTPIDGFSWVQRTLLQGERPAGAAEQDQSR